MTTEVASNEWGDVIRHDLEGILELRWLASSAQMTDDDFKATLELFAAEQEKVRLPSLLIDATEFRHEFGEGVMEWRDREIIPRYGRAGTVRWLSTSLPAFRVSWKRAASPWWRARLRSPPPGSQSAGTPSTGC